MSVNVKSVYTCSVRLRCVQFIRSPSLFVHIRHKRIVNASVFLPFSTMFRNYLLMLCVACQLLDPVFSSASSSSSYLAAVFPTISLFHGIDRYCLRWLLLGAVAVRYYVPLPIQFTRRNVVIMKTDDGLCDTCILILALILFIFFPFAPSLIASLGICRLILFFVKKIIYNNECPCTVEFTACTTNVLFVCLFDCFFLSMMHTKEIQRIVQSQR